jgi:hypothetical protein
MEDRATTGATPASSMADGARGAASNVMDQARQAAISQLESQKGKAAESVGTMAETLHQAGQSMEGSGQPVAQYVHRAADQLESLSRTLNERGVEDMLVDAEMFARRQPALFMGLAFAAGLAAARFLKSSSRPYTTMADRMRETVSSVTASTDGQHPSHDPTMRYSEPVAGQPGGW